MKKIQKNTNPGYTIQTEVDLMEGYIGTSPYKQPSQSVCGVLSDGSNCILSGAEDGTVRLFVRSSDNISGWDVYDVTKALGLKPIANTMLGFSKAPGPNGDRFIFYYDDSIIEPFFDPSTKVITANKYPGCVRIYRDNSKIYNEDLLVLSDLYINTQSQLLVIQPGVPGLCYSLQDTNGGPIADGYSIKLCPPSASGIGFPNFMALLRSQLPGNQLRLLFGTSPQGIFVQNIIPVEVPIPSCPGPVDGALAVSNLKGQLSLFAFDCTNNKLYIINQTGGGSSSTDLPQWEAQWFSADLDLTFSDDNIYPYVLMDKDGIFHVFISSPSPQQNSLTYFKIWPDGTNPGFWKKSKTEVLDSSRGHLLDPSLAANGYIQYIDVVVDSDQKVSLRYVSQPNGNDYNWYEELVEVVDPDAAIQTSGYRISATVLDENNVPVPGIEVNISSEYSRAALINRDFYRLGSNPVNIMTDPFGTISIFIETNNTLSSPKITITDPQSQFSPIEIDPQDKIKNFLSTGITQTSLTTAVDPISNRAVLSNPSTQAAGLAAQIKNLMGLSSTLENTNNQHWIFELIEEEVICRDITIDEFELRLAKCDETVKRALENPYLNDITNDWGAFWLSVWNGASTVSNMTFSPTKIVVSFVVAGSNENVSFSDLTPAKVYDILRASIDQVGTPFKVFVGWVMSESGFVFDWAKILSTSDTIKTEFKSNIKTAISKVPDMAKLKKDFDTQTDDIINNFNTYISDMAGGKLGNTSVFDGNQPASPVSLFSSGGISFVNPINYLMDIAFAQLPNYMPNLKGPTITGLDPALQKLMVDYKAGSSVIDTFTTEIIALLDNMLSNDVTTLLSTVQKTANAVLNYIKTIIDDLLDVLNIFVQNIDDLINWLDTPLSDLPFFSAFYRSISKGGQNPSLLDLICLVGAIPMSLIGLNSMDGQNNELLTFFMGLWAVFNAVSDGLSVASDRNMVVFCSSFLGFIGSFFMLFPALYLYVRPGCSNLEKGFSFLAFFLTVVETFTTFMFCTTYACESGQQRDDDIETLGKGSSWLLGVGGIVLIGSTIGIAAKKGSAPTQKEWYSIFMNLCSSLTLVSKPAHSKIPKDKALIFSLIQTGLGGLATLFYGLETAIPDPPASEEDDLEEDDSETEELAT